MSRCFLPLLAALATALAGCSRPESGPGPAPAPGGPVDTIHPVTGDWVVQQIQADPATLNPITVQDLYGMEVVSNNIIESLLTLDNYTLKLKPLLALSYEISPDKLTYTFHLRQDVKWQDGAPFTADDVKYSFDKMEDPKVDAELVRSDYENILSCTVVDPYTVRYVAKGPYFKTLEALGTLAIVPKHILEKGEPDFNKHPFGRAPIGTGPYKFVRWDTGSQIVLERDPNYWNAAADPHYPARLVYQVITESYVAAQLLKKGELDVVDGISPLQWQREMEGRPSTARLNEIIYPFPAYRYLGFNLRNPLFQDVRVRHAIDLLIPRDEILSRIYLNKYATEATGWNLPSSPANNPAVVASPYDPAQAMQLLRAAGWSPGTDGLLYKDGKSFSFNLAFGSGNDLVQKMAELIQEALQRAGITMSLQRIEFAQLVAQLDDWKFEACLLGRTNSVNDDPFASWDGSQATLKNSANDVGYSNPAADRLIAQGRVEYDDAKRNALWRQLQQVVHDDYPVCFLFNSRNILLVSKRYQNVQVFPPIPCFDVTKWWVPAPEQRYR